MGKIEKNNTKYRAWDWLSAILLIIMMQIASARLMATLWTLDLSLVMVVTFLGTILGLALGKSAFNRFWVFVLAVVYGSILIPWQLGLTYDVNINWHDRLINLWGRLEIVIQELFTKRPITDNLLFLLLMAILFWVLSTYAGFVLVREVNPWKVVIPGGITIFVIHSFDPLLAVRSLYLAFYLLFAILLVARMVYVKNTSKWSERHIHTPPDIGFDLFRVTVVLSIILVFFSWNVPVLADTFRPVAELWQTTARPWLSLKDRFNFIFASLHASVSSVQNFYSDTLPLGLGSSLTDQVVMEVQAPSNPPGGGRFYWEARTYDTYENNSWATTIKTPQALTAESKDLNQPGEDVRSQVTFTFLPHETISNIYMVSEPLWTSIPTQAYMLINSDGTINLSVLMSKGIIRPGEQYHVRSAIDNVTVKQLRNAGSDYPNWVVEEYLQLPSNITSRTMDLAKNIATGLSNPYDIVDAVTQYLRANIQYDQSISQPPSNQERIDWFLLDYKKGFCNYYASAEVILLRSLGIPARMAVGFAQGEQEIPSTQEVPVGAGQNIINAEMSSSSTYVVRQRDAHAWPEVFFPGIGWINFEPTVSQSPITRPSGEAVANSAPIGSAGRDGNITPPDSATGTQRPKNNLSSNSGGTKSFWSPVNITLLFIFLFASGLSAYLFLQVMRGFSVYNFLERISIQVPETMEKGLRRLGIHPPGFLIDWIYYMKLPAPSRSYLEINRALERVGQKPAIHDTPTERTALLIRAIPAAATPAECLLTEYQTSIYSNHYADPDLARKAATEIRNLSRREWIIGFLSRFRVPSTHRKDT
jgi:transglutaminase-like putative cysteine protease